MHRHFSVRFGRDTVMLHPGDFLAGGEDIVVSTVLGSCIAVTLFDPVAGIGGMNHFMLPGAMDDRRKFYTTTSGKYGMYAMELLINALIKQGCRKSRFEAKVFGGASILRGVSGDGHASGVSRSNIDFALNFLETERIPVAARDTGGTKARKLFYFPATSRVLLKKLDGASLSAIERNEREYMRSIRRRSQEGGSLTLF